MSELLFTVEDRFLIRGHGLLLVPGIADGGDPRIHAGDPVLLKMPDGSSKRWTIGGLQISLEQPIRPPSERKRPILFIGLDTDQVPVGTEVWSVTFTGDE